MSDEAPVARPLVAEGPRRTPVAALAGAAALLGTGVFLWLADAREARAQADGGLPPLAAASPVTPVPLVLPAAPAPPVPSPVIAASPAPVFVPPVVARPIVATPSGDADRLRERLRAPALIVDLAQAAPPPTPGTAQVLSDAPGPALPTPTLSASERFADRVGGTGVEVAVAERLTGLDRLIPQGAIIGATMETALNSDLPGYARALVSRDVLSFDGSAVLIPAGSRVIGQYQSGVAQGASRVFIVWTRLIRPDGVSVALGSPAIDDLGRGGVPGKVNRHFLQRYGGAILLSVLSGGITAAASSVGNGSTVIVGTAGEANTLARQAQSDLDIPPTITTPQGASVRIFVARDLDFTPVGVAR